VQPGINGGEDEVIGKVGAWLGGKGVRSGGGGLGRLEV